MGIDLLGYAFMGNHVHLVLRVRPDRVKAWSDAEVARHALAVLPVRSGPAMEPLAVTPAIIDRYSSNKRWLADQRERLSSPSWLLRLVKQEIARRANAEDGCAGHFWEKRFTTVELLDAAAVLACMVYVDLNPWRASLVRDPTSAAFTSIRHRAVRSRGEGRADPEADDRDLGVRLVALPNCAPADSLSRELPGWSITELEYVDLVQETARLTNKSGRSAVGTALDTIREMGFEADAWSKTMSRGGAMSGSVIGSPESRARWCRKTDQRWAADKSGLW